MFLDLWQNVGRYNLHKRSNIIYSMCGLNDYVLRYRE